MDAIRKLFQKKNRNDEAMKDFGFRLKNQFAVNESYRRGKEYEWLESLRQYKGVYDPDVQIEEGNSTVYPRLTRAKINLVLSRLHEMLFPETDKNWEIEPTPYPSIDKEIVLQLAESLIEVTETGEQILPTPEQLEQEIMKFTEETCKKMSTVIDDQLTEMEYPEETKKVLRSGLLYGTGIMKGVLVDRAKKRHWEAIGGGDYEEIQEDVEIPHFKYVRIWDWYPDMTTTDVDSLDGSYERHVMSKHDLRNLIGRDDFFGDIITQYIKENPGGDYVPKAWETSLQDIEREAGAKHHSGDTLTQIGDYDSPVVRKIGNKYEVLEYWGYIDGKDLEACGVEVDDVEVEYVGNVWLLGKMPIKVALYEGELDRYKLFYYEKDETSLYGDGLARIIRSSQLAISAGARMVLDNGACVAGPQVEVNTSLVVPGTDISSFYPRKIWFREGRGVEAQYPALRSVEFNSHVEELLGIINTFKQFSDEEATLPAWLSGQVSNNETAQAASNRQSTITISIKDIVKNFDSFTEKILRDLYAWNMDFNPRTDIKGDFKCKAKGVSSLVMKEIRMQALNQLAATLSNEDWIYIDRREFLSELFSVHDVRLRLRTQEEVDKIKEAQMQSEEYQLQLEERRAEIEHRKGQALSQLARAKQLNVKSIKEQESADDDLEFEKAKEQMDLEERAARLSMDSEDHEMDLLNKGAEVVNKVGGGGTT